MLTLKDLLTSSVTTNVPGTCIWEPALPYPDTFRHRINDAWEVLCGRAHAVRQTPPEEGSSHA